MKRITILLISLCLLQGCALAVIAGVGAGAASVNDRRTLGSQVDDQSIEVKAYGLVADNEALSNNTNIQVISLNGNVLVVGQAITASDKKKVETLIAGLQGVEKIHNQIRIAKLSTFGTQATDTWITTKVKTELLADERIDGTAIKVISEDSEVFLMGLVNASEANVAVEIARHINGVSRVYKAFEMK